MVAWLKRTKLLQKVLLLCLAEEDSTVFSAVICLSDDEEDGTSEVATPVKQQPPKLVNGLTKSETARPSGWLVHRKDIVRVSDLSIKRSDLIKKPLEIGCSVICFGIAEFHVESETILLNETDFVFKLKSKNTALFAALSTFIYCRWFDGQFEHTTGLFRYTLVLFFLSVATTCGIRPGASGIRRALRSIYSLQRCIGKRI